MNGADPDRQKENKHLSRRDCNQTNLVALQPSLFELLVAVAVCEKALLHQQQRRASERKKVVTATNRRRVDNSASHLRYFCGLNEKKKSRILIHFNEFLQYTEYEGIPSLCLLATLRL